MFNLFWWLIEAEQLHAVLCFPNSHVVHEALGLQGDYEVSTLSYLALNIDGAALRENDFPADAQP